MSGLMLKPEGGRLVLPGGEIWAPLDDTPIERCVPRVCLVPDTANFYSAGLECIDLARAAGLQLDPWQQLNIMLILAETSEGRWAAFLAALIVARQNGKGSELEALSLYWIFLRGEKLVGHSAHEYKTAMEAFRRVLWLVENNDWLRKRVKKVINTNGEEGIELLTGPRLRYMARSKGAGRGFTFHKLIWDEAYALTREQQDAQLPTMSAVDNPQIVVTSSPPLSSDTGEVLFQLRRLALALGDQMVFMDYGAEGSLDDLERIDLDDQELWKLTNPSEVHAGSGHGVSVETMERERSVMSDQGFGRERLCIWPPDLTEGFGVITKEQWERMLDSLSGAEDTPGALIGKPVISIDVSPRSQGHVTTSIGLAAERADGKHHLELIARQSGTAWALITLRAFLLRTPIAALVIDSGSPAGSLLPEIEELFVALDLSKDLILKMSSMSVASAFGMIYDAATETVPSLVHLDQPELTTAIGGAVTREVGGTGGKAWDRRNATTDITGLVAITHANWGLASVASQPVESDEPLVVWA